MYLPTLLLAMSLEVMALPPAAPSATSPAKGQGAERPYGIERRVLWTTSRVKGSPDPPAPYRTEPAFPQLRFEEPLALVSLPGTDRLAVAQRHGKIFSFRGDPRADRAELLLDAGKVVLGLAFHPHFINNGFLYVLHVPDQLKDQPRRMRVSRFEVSRTNPPRCDPRTEKVVYEWPSNGGHDGGCLVFGLDGFLYIGAGDGGISATGQDLGNAAGSIVGIDVDHPREGRGYGVPADNPFVGVAGALPEIWAYGLRQPWRFSIDRESGALWVGDVGQDLWEMVYLIERGGNYGWNVTEGSHPFRPEQRRGPTPILPPIVEHSHAEARSITGGYVYRGTRLKDLVGAYIYGDYDTGKIWGLRYEGRRVVWHKELVDSDLRLVSFGEDARGELTLVDHMGGEDPPARSQPDFGGDCRISTQAEPDRALCRCQGAQASPGVDPLLGERGVVVRRCLERTVPCHPGRRADRVRHRDFPGIPPGCRSVRLEVSGWNCARQDILPRDGEGQLRDESAAGDAHPAS
jgi:glucose/arabinose dehydrogenase